MTKEKIDITKYTKYFKAIFFITAVINILLFAQKKETILEKADYKILVQESEGSSNYVEYNGSTFPKNGYVLSSYECENGGVITQNEAKAITFTGNVDTCTLKFDLSGQMHSENSLYYVLMNEANNGGLAAKYTGEHADAYDRSGTEDIYYFTTPTANDETEGNQLLDKWNVIFGGFCWQMLRTTDTGGVKMIYNGVPTNGTCNNTGTAQLIGKSAFNSNYSSPAYAGYMYNTVYEPGDTTLAGAYMYGNSFTYSNGTYTLTDTITTSSNATENDLKNHHYTCYNTTGTCSSISYIYTFLANSYTFSIELSNGKSIENALNEMLSSSNVNHTNSTIKTYIDNWYQNNLSSYASYLEDTVFCNDRSIRTLNGWNPDGEEYDDLLFKENIMTSGLICTNETDRFSTINERAKLVYPIGLPSSPEMLLLNNKTVRKIGVNFWLASPSYFTAGYTTMRIVDSVYGNMNTNNVNISSNGVRPVISLKPGTEYSSGDGSKNNPYVVSTSN